MPDYQSLNELSNTTELAIGGTLASPELQAALAPFGYSLERLQAGRALLDAAIAAQRQQQNFYAEQLGATDALDAARDTANSTYITHLKLARIAFKDDTIASSKLELDGERERSLSGWLAQTQRFYTALLDDERLERGLARFSIERPTLEACLDAIRAVTAAEIARDAAKGASQQATQDRDAAVKTLQAWTSEFKQIARIALAEGPQRLEAIGIVVPS